MTDDETWVEGDHANTLNRFDVGDTRTTHIVVNSDSYWVEDCENAALRANGSNNGPPRTDKQPLITQTFPIDDGRPVEKHQNGTGIGKDGAPAYTLDRQQHPAVVQTFSVYPEGGNGADIAAAKVECSPALTKVKSERGVHVAETTTQPIASTLTRGGHPNSNAPGRRREDDENLVGQQMSVRRLTPVECERLMGLPDGWTAPEGVKAPDSKRYAACGDAIVTTVAFWIADRIRMIEEEEMNG